METELKEQIVGLIELRVEKGAEFLDLHRPGWATQIDMEIFDINSCSTCMLGQMFGDYTKGVEELQIFSQTDSDTISLGFNPYLGYDFEDIYKTLSDWETGFTYGVFRDAWGKQVKQRMEVSDETLS